MVTLRDPADRAFSSYLHMLRSGWEPIGFLPALQRHPELLEHGRYGTHLRRFTDRFGRDAVYVALFDDLQGDPQAFIAGRAGLAGDRAHDARPRAQPGTVLPAGRARSVALSRLAAGERTPCASATAATS